MAKQRDYHVIPSPTGGWAVRREGAERTTSVFSRKSDAMEHARSLARNTSSDLIVHGKDGRIQSNDHYGNDPMPPKDRPIGYGSLGRMYEARSDVDLTKPIYKQTSKKSKLHSGRRTK